MDKIFELGDYFVGESGNLNPLVLILSVLVVVVGAVAVFIFGFKESEPPKIRRRSSDSGGKIKKQRKVKRVKPESVPLKKEAAKTLHQKSGKKEATVKAAAKIAPSKSPPAKSPPARSAATAATKNTDSVAAASTAKSVNNDIKKVHGAASVVAKKVSNKKEIQPAKRTKNALDNNAADDGDWQTVTTKKQKKSTESLNQSSVGVDAAAKVVDSNKSVKNTKNKQSKETANKTKKATSVGQQKLNESTSKTVTEKISFKVIETNPAATPVAVAAEVPGALFDILKITRNAVKEQKPTTLEAAIEASEVVDAINGPEPNRTINELEDPGWTEAAAPKKSKKRALRE